jgi:hypothetical protein
MNGKSLEADFLRYVILGASNPGLACQVPNQEIEFGLLPLSTV